MIATPGCTRNAIAAPVVEQPQSQLDTRDTGSAGCAPSPAVPHHRLDAEAPESRPPLQFRGAERRAGRRPNTPISA